MNDCFFVAGEVSGDLHGSSLMQALRECIPFDRFRGVGGPLMRAQGLESLLKMEDFQVMGFSDVLRHLPRLWKLFNKVRDHILNTQPACLILIDYPGFNLRLAQALRQRGYKGKIIQYICPTVWAHGKGRIVKMAQTLDLLLTIYPFEAAYFAHTSLKVKYMGNPLVEKISQHSYQDNWMSLLGLPSSSNVIAIFPGSRPAEILKHTPQQLQLAARLKKSDPQIIFALSCAQEGLQTLLQEMISKSPLALNQDIYLVPHAFSYELMRDCRTALAKSGTVTLELALHQKPSVVLYTLSFLNYYIAKYLLRLNLPHYCMVNILRQKEVFPEFIGKQMDEEALFCLLSTLHRDEEVRLRIKEECLALQNHLGNYQTNQMAAQAIQEILLC